MRFVTDILAKANLVVDGSVTLNTTANASVDTDKFLVQDGTVVKYRTGAQILSDIGAQGALTLTTTGTSGPATLVGNTLNIPQYQAVLTNPITGTGVSGQVAYFNGTTSITGESNLFWDASNDRLGIGTSTPQYSLDSTGVINSTGFGTFLGFSTPPGRTYNYVTSFGSGTTINYPGTGTLGFQYNYFANNEFYTTAGGTSNLLIVGFRNQNYIRSTVSTVPFQMVGFNNRFDMHDANDLSTLGVLNGVNSGFLREATASSLGGITTAYQFTTTTRLRSGFYTTTRWGNENLQVADTTASQASSITDYDFLLNTTNVGSSSGGPGTITNFYLLRHVTNIGATGTITNRWGLYLTDSSFKSYHAGNFLIGTSTDAGYKLDVATGNDNAIRIINSTGSNNNGLALAVGSGTPWIDFWGSRLDIKYNTSPGSWNGGANTFITILSGGNVGIGTTSPATLLHLQQSSGPTIRLVRTSNRFDITGDNDFLELNARDASTYMIFKTVDTERIRITSGGSVGIGTSSPQAKLQVTNSTSDGIIVSTTANVEPFLAFWRNSASNGVGVLRLIDGGNLYFDNGATGAAQSTKMQLAATGAVRLNSYGSGSFTGTRAYDLSVDASGNIIEVPIGAGTITGSGTTNYIPKWTSSSAIGNSDLITDGSGNLAIAQGNAPTQALNIYRAGSTQTVMAAGNSNTGLNGTYFGVDPNGNGIINTTGAFANIFSTNGSERMRITSGGNVLVGTTSDAGYKLDVTGTLRVNGSNNTAIALTVNGADGSEGMVARFARGNSEKNFYISATNNQYVNLATEGDFKFKTGITVNQPYTSGVESMVITSAGRVGIGTTSPSGKLDVFSANDVYLNVSTSSNNTSAVLSLYNSSGVTDGAAICYNVAMRFGTVTGLNGSGFSEKMRITSGGAVGIGTTNPTANGLMIEKTGNHLFLRASSAAAGKYWNFDVTAANQLYIINNAGTQYLTITDGGNVGIGATTPGYKLEVQGTFFTSGNTILAGTGQNVIIKNHSNYPWFEGQSASAQIFFGRSGTNPWGIGADATYAFRLWDSSFGANYFGIFAGTGNVAIGTTTDSGFKLDVNGTGIVRGKFNVSANISDYTATFVNTNSSSYGIYIQAGGTYPAIDVYNYNATSLLASLKGNGQLRLAQYTSTSSFPGTAAGFIGFDSSGNLITVASAGGVSGSGTTNYVARWTASTTLGTGVLYDNGTNVGIGNIIPGYLLSVKGNPGLTGSLLEVWNSNTSWQAEATIRAYADNSNSAYGAVDFGYFRGLSSPGESSSGFIVKTGTRDATTIKLIVNQGGNVGIGTTSPSNLLHVYNNSVDAEKGIIIKNAYAGTSADASLRIDGYAGSFIDFYRNGSLRWRLDRIAFSDNLKLTASGGAGDIMYFVYGSGNVGINTASPIEKLHVSGSIHVQAESDTAGVNGYYLGEAGSRNIALRQTSTGKNLAIDTYNSIEGWVNRMTILNSGGNVGIGTSTPGTKLHLWGGDMFITNTTNPRIVIGDTTSGGDWGAIQWDSASDLLQLGMGPSSFSPVIIINESLNVGIGTTSPGAKLQVYGNLQLYSGTSGYSDPLVFGAETGAPKKAIFLENFWMVYQGHDNEGHKFRSVNAVGSYTDDVVITGGGNVLIGTTTNSGYKLDVNGTGIFRNELTIEYTNAIQTLRGGSGYSLIRAYGNSNTVEIQIDAHSSNSGAGTIGNYTNSDLYFKTNNTNKMVIKAGGNVGIGTTSPSYKLEVVGGAVNQQIARFVTADFPTHSIGLGVEAAGSNWGVSIFQDDVRRFTIEENGGILVGSSYQSSDAPANGAIIQGNVGIGSTTPDGRLYVERTATWSSGNLLGTNTVQYITYGSGASPGTVAISAVGAFQQVYFSGSATIGNGGRHGAIDSILTIGNTSSGTITVSQSSTLRAMSSISAATYFNPGSSTTITHLAGIRVLPDINTGAGAVTVNNKYGILIGDASGGSGSITYTTRWGIYQEGASDNNYFAAKVLIGTTTATSDALYVNGTAYINGNMTVNGTVTELSSANYKRNISTLENTLEKVDKMRAVSYNRVGGIKKEIGLIAEEVEQVYPEFVEYDNNGRPMGLNYARLTAVLLQSIKELNGRINELENRN